MKENNVWKDGVVRDKPNTIVTMEWITPEKAEEYLKKNIGNRRITRELVELYARDMASGNWDESNGETITFDKDGILRNGQHRLTAMVRSGTSLWMLVNRGSSTKIFVDGGKKRSNTDQMAVLHPEYENVYKTTRYNSVANALIDMHRRRKSPSEICQYTERHKKQLDGFFLLMPYRSYARISIAPVWTALYLAYAAGVDMSDILSFYNVLVTGMSSQEKEYPIIAYRNYLFSYNGTPHNTFSEIGRCQFALDKYLKESGTRQSRVPKKLIWPFPSDDDKEPKQLEIK